MESSAEKVESSGQNVESSGQNEGMPVITISASQKLQLKLLDFAASGWRTLPELAEATEKSGKYLINNIIPNLIQAEKLDRCYPAATHPNQAYRTLR